MRKRHTSQVKERSFGNKKRFYWINEQQAKFNFIDQVPDPVSAKPSDLKVFDELNLMHISFYGKKLQQWGKLFLENALETSTLRDSFDHSTSRDYEYLLDLDELLFFWIRSKNSTTKSRFPISKTNLLRDSFTGDGIVLCVNDKYAIMAYTTIQMIRQVHNSKLPIEIFYMGDNDLSSDNQKLLNSLPNTVTVNLDDIFDLEVIRVWGWSSKTFALLASSFQNAMLIDADILFIQSPERFFNSDLFKKHGALFFQDRTIPFASKIRFRHTKAYLDSLFPPSSALSENRLYTGKSQHHQESGVVLVDKKSRFTGLMAACILNSGDVRTESYRHMHGDKETFWIGFEIVGQDYAFNPYSPGAVGKKPKKVGSEICSVQLFHVDENYSPAWINGGILHNKMIDNHTIATFEAWMVEPGKWYSTANFSQCIEPTKRTRLNFFSEQELEKIDRSIAVYTQSIKDIDSKGALLPTLPKQLSPWSYDSRQCSEGTFESQFSTWLEGKKWDKNNDYGYGQYKREMEFYIKNYKAPAVRNSGRGIIYSCHPRLVQITMVSIGFLRNFGCNLPIEIWHMDELMADDIARLESLEGVKVYNLAHFIMYNFPRDKDGKIYALKTAAILHSHFDEILFLDGDNYVVQDPTFLFESPPYLETGALFWKDLWKTRPDNPLWNVLGIKCVDEFEQESGQMVIKKSFPGVQKALDVAYFMQMQSDFYYELTLGDKDTFRLSMRALGQPFHLIRPHMAILGAYTATDGTFCGHSMVQYAPYWGEEEYGPLPSGYFDPPQPEILFIHANSLKYQYDALKSKTIFGTLKHYKNPITLNAKARCGPGLCVHLDATDSSELVIDDFKAMFPEFELLYRKLYRQFAPKSK